MSTFADLVSGGETTQAPTKKTLGQTITDDVTGAAKNVQKTASKVVKALPKPIVNTLQFLATAAQVPSESVNAAFGTPMRIVHSLLGQMHDNPRGAAEVGMAALGLPSAAMFDPKAMQQMGHSAYAVGHPNDPRIQANAEHATGVDKLLSTPQQAQAMLPFLMAMAKAKPNSEATGFQPVSREQVQKTLIPAIQKAQDFGVHTGFQIGTDPLTPASGGTGAFAEHVLSGYEQAVSAAMRNEGGLAKSLVSEFVPDAPMREAGLNQSQRARAYSIISKHQHAEKLLSQEHESLLDRNHYPLKYADKPSKLPWQNEVRSLLQRSPYVDGSSAIEADKGGFLHRGGSLRDKIGEHLAKGRHQLTQENIKRDLYSQVGLTKDQIAKVMETHAAPKSTLGTMVSGARTKAMLITGVPHGRNVGVAGYLAGGSKLIARAVKFYSDGIPEDLMGELNQGGRAHFAAGEGMPTPFKQLGQATSRELNNWDDCVRAARLEQLRKEMPNAHPLERVHQVNLDIGPYGQTSRFTRQLRGLGAQFPQWHGYAVPTMVARAALKNPGRIHRMLAAEQNANDTFGGKDAKYRLTPGGPLDEASQLAAFPFGTLRWATSPSMLGVLPNLFEWGQEGPQIAGPQGKSRAKRAALDVGEFLASMAPLGSQAFDAVANPYNVKAPAAARVGLSLTGPYLQKRTKWSKNRTSHQSSATGSGGKSFAELVSGSP